MCLQQLMIIIIATSHKHTLKHCRQKKTSKPALAQSFFQRADDYHYSHIPHAIRFATVSQLKFVAASATANTANGANFSSKIQCSYMKPNCTS